MRFWSGADPAYGKDHLGAAVVIMGPEDARIALPGDVWRRGHVRDDGAVTWRLAEGGELARIQPPCPDEYAEVLFDRLTLARPAALHPGLVDGLQNEALRLYPDLSDDAVLRFEALVAYLREHFGLTESLPTEEQPVPFVDGFGPELLVLVDDEPCALPELPPVHLAPGVWLESMWWVSTRLIGPDTSDGMPPEDRLRFSDALPDASRAFEGLVYYQAARAMVAWAAWEGDSDGRFLRVISDVVLGGIRPLRRS
jgi:hypothetical protein